jgi:N-acyl amino acid synthase of PEP-CTERM/exosortase system
MSRQLNAFAEATDARPNAPRCSGCEERRIFPARVANFEFVEVHPGTALYRDYLALRYEVFVRELGQVVDSAPLHSAVETDRYDQHSHHMLAVHAPTGLPVACARLILPNQRGLNVWDRYEILQYPYPAAAQRDICGEISRMAIASPYRRAERWRSDAAPDVNAPAHRVVEELHGDGSRTYHRELTLGMFLHIYRLSTQYGLDYCYAAMTPTFARLLNRLGFPFQAVGPLNLSVQPPRRPYIIGRERLEHGLTCKHRLYMHILFGAAGPGCEPGGSHDMAPGAEDLPPPCGAVPN